MVSRLQSYIEFIECGLLFRNFQIHCSGSFFLIIQILYIYLKYIYLTLISAWTKITIFINTSYMHPNILWNCVFLEALSYWSSKFFFHGCCLTVNFLMFQGNSTCKSCWHSMRIGLAMPIIVSRTVAMMRMWRHPLQTLLIRLMYTSKYTRQRCPLYVDILIVFTGVNALTPFLWPLEYSSGYLRRPHYTCLPLPCSVPTADCDLWHLMS